MQSFQPVGEVPKELECSICLEIWINAVEVQPCHHLFCKNCVSQLPNCPLCRSPITSLVAPNRALVNLADGIKVKCLLCHWTGTREASRSHKERCSQVGEMSSIARGGSVQPPAVQPTCGVPQPTLEASTSVSDYIVSSMHSGKYQMPSFRQS